MEADHLPDAKSHILRYINSCETRFQLVGAGTCISLFQNLFSREIDEAELKLHVADLSAAWTKKFHQLNPDPIITSYE